MFEAIELLRILRAKREERLSENLSQRELLKREFKLIALALVAIVVLFGAMGTLVWFIRR